MRTIALALGCVLFALSAAAKPAVDPTAQWTIAADVGAGKTHVAYTSQAWVYSASQRYSATLYAIGPYHISDQTLPVVRQFADIKDRSAPTVVFNGGFSSDAVYNPAGLLLVAGRVANPFSFEKTAKGDYRLSAILCQSQAGRLKLLKTADFATKNSDIATVCWSALQAGPMIVQDGRNVINPTELALRPYVRTVLGFDKHGRPRLVIFEKPINLYIAAEFLRAAPGKSGQADQASVTGNGAALGSSSGLGLQDAINLNGDDASICEYRGTLIFGNPKHAIPSAIAIRSN